MRREDWKAALSAELLAARKRHWKWGEHDCTALGARCAEAVTGEPYFERIRKKFAYETAHAAGEYLRETGLKELISAELGEAVPWVRCRHGDLVLCACEVPDGIFNQILTVHDGAQLLAAKTVGIMRIPFDLAICGWKL